MKTKFFKKLSFVLALAMVLSIFAPAAGAFAAKAPKLNSTKKYLHLDVEDKNEFNFNIANKKKGWKYFWESANEDVAVVNEKNGVTTATGAGKTKVKVTITDADGEEVDVLSATVTVRDNIETVKISNPVETLAVGEEHDYNRSYVTVSNRTKGSQSVTRWTVEPSDTATINDKGVFVATEAGEYTITARSFQSKARYNAWLKDAEANEDEVLATDTTKVVVSGSMLGAKQKDLVKFDVTFDSAMDEDAVKENLKVYLLLGTAKSRQYVKSISLDEATSTVATVEMYGDFNKGMTYVVEYPDMDPVDFEATSTNYTDVVELVIDTKSVVATYEGGSDADIEFTLLNAAGIDITEGVDSEFGGKLKDRVSFETSSTGAYVHDNKISIFEVGTVAEVKGTYKTLKYDEFGKEIGTLNAVALIIGTKDAVVPAGSLSKYTVTLKGDNPDWDKDLVTRVAVGADRARLFALVKDSDDEDVKSEDDVENKFKFESSDNNTLFVSPTGELYPIKEGAVVVIVKYGDTIVGYANITVVPASKATVLSLSDYAFTLSTAVTAEDSKTVEITLKDQYGDDASVDSAKSGVTHLDTSNSKYMHIEVDESKLVDDKKVTFNVKAGAEAGIAVFEIKVNDMKRTVTITLKEANHKADGSDVRYRLEVSNIDLNIEKAENLTKKLDIKLIGYAPNGVKATTNAVSKAGFSVDITGEADLAYNEALYTAASGGAITKIKTGTYKVVAKDGDTVLDTKYFTVSDTQKAPTMKVVNAFYTKVDLADIADECFEIKIDGKDHDGVVRVETGAIDDNKIFIDKVIVKQDFGASYLEHEVKVGLTVYKKN